eukprot:gene9217-1503_t
MMDAGNQTVKESDGFYDEQSWITADELAFRRRRKFRCCNLEYWKNLDRMNFIYLIAFTLLLIIIIAGVLTAHKESSRPAWDIDRLPTHVRPSKYNISLYPDINNLTVIGFEEITINMSDSTAYVILHAMDMNIQDCILRDESNTAIALRAYFQRKELLVVHPRERLSPGTYILSINFTYIIRNNLAGLYYSTYTAPDEKTRTILTTQMEPLDARKAFPCFDEPAFKASFAISTYKPKGYIALSNMPPVEDVRREDAGVVYFDSTPYMSTYLVALVICDFEFVNTVTATGIPIRVFSPMHQACDFHFVYLMVTRLLIQVEKLTLIELNDTTLAKNVSRRVLEFYENIFNISYALPKLDLIAIPDFAAGAMENWGIITYRETALLYNNDVAANSDRQYVALVVAHELAHQWFGNLVTMKWWNDLWLNEGFATLMEQFGVDDMFPSWDVMTQFLASVREPALSADSVSGIHPLHSEPNEILSRQDIDARFDTISYEKGASVLRMLSSILSKGIFFNALTAYMNTYKYQNTISEDLWFSIDKYIQDRISLKFDVKTLMTTWASKPGFPVVNVEFVESNTSLTISQQRFLSAAAMKETKPLKVPVSGSEAVWIVPLTATPLTRRFDDKCTQKIYWPPDTKAVTYSTELKNGCHPQGTNDAFLANLEAVGYYRVNYTARNWQLLIEAVENTNGKLTGSDIAALIYDAFALNMYNLLDVNIPMQLLQVAPTVFPLQYPYVRFGT